MPEYSEDGKTGKKKKKKFWVSNVSNRNSIRFGTLPIQFIAGLIYFYHAIQNKIPFIQFTQNNDIRRNL